MQRALAHIEKNCILAMFREKERELSKFTVKLLNLIKILILLN